jgi:hypothetical protein
MAWRTVTEGFEADLYKVPTPKFFYTEQGDRGRLNLLCWKAHSGRIEPIYDRMSCSR